MTGSAVGERVLHATDWWPNSATKGAVRCLPQGLSREVGSRVSGQQRPAGSHRHGFESRRGRLGGASEGRPALDRYGMFDEVAALVRSSPVRSLVHYRGESHR